MSSVIGQKNKRVTLQQIVNEEWAEIGKVWASLLQPPKSAISDFASNSEGILSRTICIWRRKDICKGWRIICEDDTYEVLDTYNSPDNSETFVICERRRLNG